MSAVRQMTFPKVELSQEEAAPARREPHSPWQAKPLKVEGAGSNVLFPDLDGNKQAPQSLLRRHKAMEQKREKELEQKVAAIMAEAQVKGREAGYQEGLAQGHAEGLEKGREQAQAELEELANALESALATLVNARQELVASMEMDLVESTVDLAGSLAGGALEVEPERVVELARQGMALLAESDQISIRAIPLQAALIREAQNSLAASLNVTSLRVVEDPSLETEGCVVESDLGRVDMRVSQRLQAARELLRTVRNED